jgi:hypothetical protein
MQLKNTIPVVLAILFISTIVEAQTYSSRKASQKKSFEASTVVETHNLQFALINKNGVTLSNSPRYSYYFNAGFDMNWNINSRLKPFTGMCLKNIGLIMHEGLTTTKHRVYFLGFPLGVKAYGKSKRNFLKLGADFNLALNYKQKTFIDGKKEDKFNEWRSSRVPTWYPSVFAGVRYESLSVTLNYYYNNFFNKDYTKLGLKPYTNTDAQMVTISFGINLDNKVAQQKLKQKFMKSKAVKS